MLTAWDYVVTPVGVVLLVVTVFLVVWLDAWRTRNE
jgi:hypothetical protein